MCWGVPGMTELRVVRARIAGLGRALQDPIDQQILWHLLSVERGGAAWVQRAIATTRANAPGRVGGGACCRLLEAAPVEGGEVKPSLTAEVTRRPKPEIRVHYRRLHEQGLIERRSRVARLGWAEHTYVLAPCLRPVLETISAFALPGSSPEAATGEGD